MAALVTPQRTLRAFDSSDALASRRMYDLQGFDYEFPDLNSPLFLSKVVLTEKNRPVMMVGSRLTAEIYLFLDKNWGTPELRWQAFLEAHEAARKDLYSRGLEDCYCWLPPQIENAFGKRLMRLGWGKNVWPSFTRRLDVPTEDLRETCAYSQSWSAT